MHGTAISSFRRKRIWPAIDIFKSGTRKEELLLSDEELASPKGVDKTRCIKCGRCVAVCPTKSRRFYGIKYSLAAARFNTTFTTRRANEVWYAEGK